MERFQIEERLLKSLQVEESELMTLSAAAERMGLKINTIGSLVERGTLRRVVDLGEPNPTRRTRVFRVDVEAEMTRRRMRRGEGDSRLRGRVK